MYEMSPTSRNLTQEQVLKNQVQKATPDDDPAIMDMENIQLQSSKTEKKTIKRQP